MWAHTFRTWRFISLLCYRLPGCPLGSSPAKLSFIMSFHLSFSWSHCRSSKTDKRAFGACYDNEEEQVSQKGPSS